MLRRVQKNKSSKVITKHLLFALALTLILGCSYNTILPGMTAADLEMKYAGYHLECTDYRDENCVVMEWINGTAITNTTVD